jgi:hypothetical protein
MEEIESNTVPRGPFAWQTAASLEMMIAAGSRKSLTQEGLEARNEGLTLLEPPKARFPAKHL